MVFDLLKQGTMKKFSGSWKIDPFNASSSDDNYNQSPLNIGQTGSLITFNQVVEPSIVTPWPLKGLVKGVTTKFIKELLGDLQCECMHIAQSKRSEYKFDPKGG